MSFDGGARTSIQQSANACCVWLNSGLLLWWAASVVYPSGANNEMEVHGLLTGLRWLAQHHRTTPIHVIGDSAVIVNMALTTYCVSANNLKSMIRDIRELLSLFRHATLQAAPRAYNVAADGLCNWIMDFDQPRIIPREASADDTEWPLPLSLSLDPIQNGCPVLSRLFQPAYDLARWRARWSFVMVDFLRVSHLVRNRFLGLGSSVRVAESAKFCCKRTYPFEPIYYVDCSELSKHL